MSAIAEKIQKLLAKADSSTHPEEAEAFMTKAQQLLKDHGLSLLDIGRLDKDDPVGKLQDHDRLYANSNASWRTIVANELAQYYGCRLVTNRIWRDGNTYWTIFGRESARVTFSLMWPFVDRQILAAGRQGYREGHYKSTKQAHAAVGRAMAVRLVRLNRERIKAEPQGTGVNALVPVDLIQQLMEETYPSLRVGKQKSLKYDAEAAKLAAGISLYQQTKAAAGTLQIGK